MHTKSHAKNGLRELPLNIRIRRLCFAIALLAGIVYLAQFPITMIPAFQTYSTVVDQNGLHPGALYYTDVHVTGEAEKFVREAINLATADKTGQ